LISSAVGMRRISNPFTRTQHFARRTCCNSHRLLPPIRAATELTLDPPDATTDEAGVPLLDENYVILSTIHSAKGQKRAAIFLLNTVDGCLPSDLATGSTPAAICLIEFQRWRELGFCKRRYLRTNCPWREGSGAPQTRQGNSRSTVSGPASPLIKW
jgi:hypothetical protein